MANNTNNTNNVPKLMKITLPEPAKFNNVISTLTLTSTSLEEQIAELFSSVFEDFEGCKIIPDGESLRCNLYFKPVMNKSEGLYAAKSIGEINNKPKSSSFFEMINTVNQLSVKKHLELEDMAKELLAEFVVIRDPNNIKTVKRYDENLGKEIDVRMPRNWDPFIAEVVDPIPNTRYQNPYLAVSVDLVLLVAKMYGKKDEQEVKALAGKAIPKDRYQYQVNIVKSINASTQSFILEVRRIDIRAIDKLCQSIGYGQISGSIVMTRK